MGGRGHSFSEIFGGFGFLVDWGLGIILGVSRGIWGGFVNTGAARLSTLSSPSSVSPVELVELVERSGFVGFRGSTVFDSTASKFSFPRARVTPSGGFLSLSAIALL